MDATTSDNRPALAKRIPNSSCPVQTDISRTLTSFPMVQRRCNAGHCVPGKELGRQEPQSWPLNHKKSIIVSPREILIASKNRPPGTVLLALQETIAGGQKVHSVGCRRSSLPAWHLSKTLCPKRKRKRKRGRPGHTAW